MATHLATHSCPQCSAKITLPLALPTMALDCPSCGANHEPPGDQREFDDEGVWVPQSESTEQFGPAASAVLGHYVLFGAAIIAGAAMAVAAVYIMAANPGQLAQAGRFGVGVGLLAFGLVIAFVGWRQIRSAVRRVGNVGFDIYADGFVLRDVAENENSAIGFRWREIKAIVHTHAITSPYLENNPLLVVSQSNQEIYIESSLHANHKVVSTLQDHTLQNLLAEYLESITAGDTISFVDFGPQVARDEPTIHIHSAGVVSGEQRFGWSEISDCQLTRTALEIKPKSGRAIYYANPLTIPNVHVLAELVRKHTS